MVPTDFVPEVEIILLMRMRNKKHGLQHFPMVEIFGALKSQVLENVT